MPRKKARARQAKQLAIATAANPTAVRPARTRPGEAARQFAVDCARLMNDDHCEDLVVLDLRGVSPVCDYFVIATGTSDRQMRAVADHIKEMGKARDEQPYGMAGYGEGLWIVVDYVDVIIHLFDPDHRAYYDLESLWGDCPKIEWAG